jgi:hypothetical protein
MAKKKISITQKRWLLSLHILCTVIWLGAGFCSLVLNIVASVSSDTHTLNAVYAATEDLDKALIRAGAIATLATGILLSVLTHWGLLRFYWIMVKEVLTVVSIFVGFVISDRTVDTISMTMTDHFHVLQNSLYTTNQIIIFCGIIFEIVCLSAVIAISVFKPWGQRKLRVATNI